MGMASIPELLNGHLTLEVECLDRLYLNGYIANLATGPQLSYFMRAQLGKPVPSPAVLGQITEKFREAVKALAQREQIPMHEFQRKEDKDETGNEFRRKRGTRDGIVFIGVAQEKAHAFNGKKVNGQFEFNRDKTVYVNHYYFYIDDEDFGPLLLKVCSYAPWAIKLCLNGHEWAKRQLEKRKIAYEALDHGFLSCAEPEKLQQICDSLGSEDIERVFRKWLTRLPLPLRAEDREAGYDWSLSIWQMEVSLTQIFDRPLRGREFFEEIIRDNLDLGRPDRVQVDLRPGSDQEDAGPLPDTGDPGWRTSQPAYRIQELRSEAVLQGRQGMPDGRHVPESEGLWDQQGIVQSGVPAKDRTANQPATTGSRTRQPQQWHERRQRRKNNATDRRCRR